MAAGTVKVRGLRELQRDFRRISQDLAREVKDELKKVAEPVADRAQELALSEIRNMPLSPDWAAMRTGATQKSVYVVPGRRRRSGGSGRPNLSSLMLERAMDPALEDREGEVVRELERVLDGLAGRYGF